MSNSKQHLRVRRDEITAIVAVFGDSMSGPIHSKVDSALFSSSITKVQKELHGSNVFKTHVHSL